MRSFDRINDLIPTVQAEGEILFHGKNIYDEDVDLVEVRRRVGMVFQKPNPFPKSIVTHNMQQAARATDFTAFFNMDRDRAGYLVEYDVTENIFTSPKNEMTEQYITGRFG